MRLSSARALKAELLHAEAPLVARSAVRCAGAVGGAAIAAVARQLERRTPLIQDCAIGVISDGRREYRIAVRVRSKGMIASSEVELIRSRARGEIEVRATGRVRPQVARFPRRRHRPPIAGTSVGHFNVTAGTLGYFARRDHLLGFISNNHVLANSNSASLGDAILQPGAVDGGARPHDEIGSLRYFVPIQSDSNLVDCAFAAFDSDDIPSDILLPKIGKVKGINEELSKGMKVSKFGRTTGLTHGRITAFELDNFPVDFEELGEIRFDEQIEIEGAGPAPFSRPGDSGSLVVDARRRAIGLLFAGGDSAGKNGKGLTYACPISAVLQALNAELLE